MVGAVFFFNVQCALLFLFSPAAYLLSFGLTGAAGEAALRGLGILFLMWNVPYAFALYHPLRNRRSLIEAVIMQAVGLAGETFIRGTLPGDLLIARASLTRFILFDGAGLAALILALVLTFRHGERAQ